MRAGTDPTTVDLYAADMDGDWGSFPAVIVYHDGTDHWLADGFHRIAAYLACEGASELHTVPVDIRAGTRRDAMLHAAGANASHGLRRTDADKRRAVETMLRDEEWSRWSNQEIARCCIVSPSFVTKIRASLSIMDSENSATAPAERTYKTKHGTEATMNTGNIGKNKPAKPAAQPPVSPEQRQYDSQVAAALPAAAERRLEAVAALTAAADTSNPAGLPADLARRGWGAAAGRRRGQMVREQPEWPARHWRARRPEDAIAEMYGKQRDLAWEAQAEAEQGDHDPTPADPTPAFPAIFAAARSDLLVAITAMQAAEYNLAGFHDEIAGELRELVEDVRRLVKELQP